jgi:hypothetical protein
MLLLASASFHLGFGLFCLYFATTPLLFGMLARLSRWRLRPRFFTWNHRALTADCAEVQAAMFA